jgi:hypothetical protein
VGFTGRRLTAATTDPDATPSLRTASPASEPRRATAWRPLDRDLWLLVLAGVVLLCIFGSIVARFPLLHYFPGNGIQTGFDVIFGDDWVQGSWWYFTTFSAAFALFGLAYLLIPRRLDRTTLALIFGFAALFSLLLIYMYPATAIDIFHYYAAARVLWVYHQNPMAVPVGAHPFIIGISFEDRASPYGPLWQLLTGPTTVLAGNHWTMGLLGLKLVAAAGFLGSGWIVYLIARHLSPERALTAAFLFCWNPFILFRVVGNGHNDIWMVLFILLSIYCAIRGHWIWILPALAASVLVKYTSLLIGPPLALYVIEVARSRRDWRPVLETAVGGVAALLMAIAVTLPFWNEAAFLRSAALAMEAITSTPLLLAAWLSGRVAAGSELADATQITRVLFAVLYVLLLATIRPRPERLLAVSTLALFAYLAVATVWFRPWYCLWFIPLAALLPGRWYLAFGIASSYLVNFAELVEHYRSNLAWLAPHFLGIIAAPVVVQFLVPALVALAALLVTRSVEFHAELPASEGSGGRPMRSGG